MASLVQLLHFSEALHVRVETGSASRQRASDTLPFWSAHGLGRAV